MTQEIISSFKEKLSDRAFPCVAARSALGKGNIEIFIAGHLACPEDDTAILRFIYEFTKKFRQAEKGFSSAVVIFARTPVLDEKTFESFLFQRLTALRKTDALSYKYDERVDEDPLSANFSLSLMEEAFFIIGLHPGSSRPARQFEHAAIVFNPHVQFDKMRAENKYEKMKSIVRQRDMAYAGSVNPALADFGSRSEVFQYSGRQPDEDDRCPFYP